MTSAQIYNKIFQLALGSIAAQVRAGAVLRKLGFFHLISRNVDI